MRCVIITAPPEVKKPFSWAALASKNSSVPSPVMSAPVMAAKPPPMKAEVKIDNAAGPPGPLPQRAPRCVIFIFILFL